MPHFLHPTEELYGGIKDKVADYNTPAFDSALLKLADAVKQKNSADYATALQPVMEAVAAGHTGLKAKEKDWPSFVVATAIMALKAAANEYEGAIVKGRIAKPVEYQDSRMIDSAASELGRKDAGALKTVQSRLAQLKKIWPAPVPPKTPVKSAAAVAADVAEIQRASGKLM